MIKIHRLCSTIWLIINNLLSFDYFRYLGSEIIPAIFGILLSAIVTRLMDLDQFGIYSSSMAILGIIVIPFSQLVNQPYFRYNKIAEKGGYKQAFDITNLLVLASSILFIFLIEISLFTKISSTLNFGIRDYLLFAVLSIFMLLYDFVQTILQSNLLSQKSSVITIILSMLKFIITILVITISPYAINMLLALLISYLLVLMFSFRKIVRVAIPFKIEKTIRVRETIKEYLKYGLPFIGWFLFSQVLNSGDRILINHIMGPAQVAIYSGSYTLSILILGFVLNPLITTIHPIIMNNYEIRKDINNLLNNSIKILMIIGMAIVLFEVSFSHFLIKLLAPEYVEGIGIIPWVGIGFLIWRLSLIAHKTLEIEKKTTLMLIFSFLSAVVNILLNFLLIPKLQIIGAAVATCISYCSYALLIYFYSTIKGSFWKFSLTQVLKIVFCGLMSLFFIKVMDQYVDRNVFFYNLTLIAIPAILIYLISLYIINIIEIADIQKFYKNYLNIQK